MGKQEIDGSSLGGRGEVPFHLIIRSRQGFGKREIYEGLQEKGGLKDRKEASLPLSVLVAGVSSFFDLQPEEICRPRKARFLAGIRGVACYPGVRFFGYKGLEIGKMLCLGLLE